MADPRRVLVVDAHPDDELLGCGGTLALHTARGDSVTAVIGSLGRDPDGPQPLDSKAALSQLGVSDVRSLGLPDQAFDTFTLTDVISPLEEIAREIRPNVVYTHHHDDINRDHQLLFKAVLVITRPTDPWVEAVYSFDTASSTEWGYPRSFVPDTWVDISETIDAKLRAMAEYESELRPYPHPRSLEALKNRAEAAGNLCCLTAAEVFMTVRRIARGGQALP